MHEVTAIVTAVATQVAHILAIINPAEILPPPWS
jgi:hypothetical protein